MAVELKESGEKTSVLARNATQEMQAGNIAAAKPSLARAEMSAGKHMKEIKYWIERYTAAEEQYKQQERDLTASINNVLAQEQCVERQKSEAETRLNCERSELSRHRSDLSSAEDRLSDARRKAREANTGKVITGVAAGLLTIFSFGAAAPITAPLAMGAAGGAMAFSQAEKAAENDVGKYRSTVRDCEQKISRTGSTISSLSTSISQLRNQRLSYMTQRGHLQEEKGKVKEVIAFLLDAQRYWSQFSIITKDCINHTALCRKIVVKAEARGYSLFDSRGTKRVLATFKEAWDAFEEMNENGSNYNFEMDFQCTRCSNLYHEFPHVNNGRLICSSCHE